MVASLNAEGLVSELGWLRTWLEEDLEGAWVWFESHVAGLGGVAGKQVQAVADAIVESKWLQNPISEANTVVLMRMHRLLTAHLPIPVASITTDEHGIFGHPIARLIESIPRILVQIRGSAANRALVDLATAEADVKVQFERHGYFVADREDHGVNGKAVFNRVTGLKDSWGK